MQFVFINPRRQYARFNVWRYINPVIPPIGLATLAAVLEEQGGHEVVIIDAHAEQLSDREVVTRVGKPDYIGITATTPEIEEAKRLSRLLKKATPNSLILMGGPHPTVLHEELVSEGWCDAVVRGEGEIPVARLGSGDHLSEICSITWRKASGQVVVNPSESSSLKMDDIPFPAYHLLPMHKYKPAIGAAKKAPAFGIITSRGCPGKCSFCLSGSNPQKTRYQSASKVMQHIELLVNQYGAKEILFYDDTFTGSRKRVVEICESLISLRAKLSWVCFARVDTVNPDLLHLMKQAGCHQISYGIESPDAEMIAMMNKKICVDGVRKAITWAKAAGIDVRGAFMIGSPGETASAIQRTIAYAQELQVDYAMFNITTPFPGTELYRQMEAQDLLSHKEWDRYDLANPVLKLPSVSPAELKSFYGKAYRSFYLNPRYILRRLLAGFLGKKETWANGTIDSHAGITSKGVKL